jgi:glutaredoxin
MCRERKVYTTSADPYCRFVKQHFNEKGIAYQEVDIGRHTALSPLMKSTNKYLEQ